MPSKGFVIFLKTLKLSEWPSFREGSTAFRVSIGLDGFVTDGTALICVTVFGVKAAPVPIVR